MALITVDSDKCVNDGLCQDACPGHFIEIDDNGLPHPVPDIANECFRCGHCVAICPTDALTHAEFSLNEFFNTKDELEMGQEAIEQFIKSRRSIRNYLEKPIPREVVEKLLDTTRFAPTAHNDQNVTYSVYDNREVLKEISDCIINFLKMLVDTNQDRRIPLNVKRLIKNHESGFDDILRHAPVLIVTHCPKMDPVASVSSHIALATLQLAAIGLGLGTCWAGLVMAAAMGNYEPVLKLLNIPNGQQLNGAMILGYPQLKYKKIPARNKPNIIWNH